ncbi:MAG: UV damage repair endonuclease, partial [uncultured Solirubrobacteraceae bacterium]
EAGFRGQGPGRRRAADARRASLAVRPPPALVDRGAARGLRLPRAPRGRHVSHDRLAGALRDPSRHAAVPPPGRGGAVRAGRARRPRPCAGPAAVEPPEPVHRPELRGPGRAGGRHPRHGAPDRAARRHGARPRGGRRAARRRRRGRLRGGPRALGARLGAAVGALPRAPGGRERRPHVLARPRHGAAPPHRRQGGLGHPAPPLQRPRRRRRSRGAGGGAVDLAAGRAAEDPLLDAQDGHGGAQAQGRASRRAQLGAAAAARARRRDRPHRLRALRPRDGRRPGLRRDAGGQGQGPRPAEAARAAGGARARGGRAYAARHSSPPGTRRGV